MGSVAAPHTTDQDHRNLTGRKALIAHERTKMLEPGWYMGRIKLFGVSASWQKVCTSANFLVRYAKKETDNALDGDSAIELTTHSYGRDEWWLLLDAAAAGAVSGSERFLIWSAEAVTVCLSVVGPNFLKLGEKHERCQLKTGHPFSVRRSDF